MATRKRRRSTSVDFHDAALTAFTARKAHVNALYREIAAALKPRTPEGALAYRALGELHRIAKGRMP